MKKRFAIFHIDGERTIKGGQRQLLYLAFQLRALGHWNCIVCRKGSQLDVAGRKAGFDMLYLPFLLEWDPISALMLRGQILARQTQPQSSQEQIIVHAHTAHAAAVSWLANLTGGGLRVCHRRDEYPLSGTLSVRLKYCQADKVVASSESIRKVMVLSGVPAEKTVTINDSAPATGFPWDEDPETFRKTARERLFKELDIPPDSFCVGSIAALESQRDPTTFARAVPLVLQEVPWTHFVISGDGPLLGELKRLSLELKIPHRLHVMGNSDDPLALMTAFDIFTIASRGEGIGGSVLEAMAAGTPVVSVRASCAQEIIEDGLSGFLVNPNSPAELARILIKLLKSPEQCNAMRRAAHERRKKFLSEAAAQRMVEVYAEIAAKR